MHIQKITQHKACKPINGTLILGGSALIVATIAALILKVKLPEKAVIQKITKPYYLGPLAGTGVFFAAAGTIGMILRKWYSSAEIKQTEEIIQGESSSSSDEDTEVKIQQIENFYGTPPAAGKSPSPMKKHAHRKDWSTPSLYVTPDNLWLNPKIQKKLNPSQELVRDLGTQFSAAHVLGLVNKKRNEISQGMQKARAGIAEHESRYFISKACRSHPSFTALYNLRNNLKLDEAKLPDDLLKTATTEKAIRDAEVRFHFEALTQHFEGLGFMMTDAKAMAFKALALRTDQVQADMMAAVGVTDSEAYEVKFSIVKQPKQGDATLKIKLTLTRKEEEEESETITAKLTIDLKDDKDTGTLSIKRKSS